MWILGIEPRPFRVGGKCLSCLPGPTPSSYRLLNCLSHLCKYGSWKPVLRDPADSPWRGDGTCERVLGELQTCPRGDCLLSDTLLYLQTCARQGGEDGIHLLLRLQELRETDLAASAFFLALRSQLALSAPPAHLTTGAAEM